jgi:hypothetical protein
VKWAIFKKRSAIHVCPVDEDGEVDEEDHTLTIECRCDPAPDGMEKLTSWPLVVHRYR